MFYLILITVCLRCSIAEWLQINQEFINISYSDSVSWIAIYNGYSGWSYYYDQVFRYQSPNNLVYFVKLDYYTPSVYNSFYLDWSKKIFQSQIILDVIFDHKSTGTTNAQFVIWPNASTNTQMLLSNAYNPSSLIKQSNQICNSQAIYPFQVTTFISTPTIVNYSYFYLFFRYYISYSYEYVYLRNLLVYVQICAPKCKTCTGTNANECSTCNVGSVQPSGNCECNQENQFSFAGIGCLNERPRNYQVADKTFNCIPDRRIKSFSPQYTFSGSTIFSPFEFVPDDQFPTFKQYTTVGCFYGTWELGSFQYSEGVSSQLTEISALVFLRLRFTFSLQLQVDSRINIHIDDDEIVSSILRTDATNFKFCNAINITTIQTASCTGMRVETTVFTVPTFGQCSTIPCRFRKSKYLYHCSFYVITRLIASIMHRHSLNILSLLFANQSAFKKYF